MVERLILRWLHPIAPIYRRELTYAQNRPESNLFKRGRGWLRRIFNFVLILAAIDLILGALLSGPKGIVNLLIVALYVLFMTVFVVGVLALPFYFLALRLRITITASSAIAREVEAQTWALLCVTPWPVKEIVLTKYAAVLVQTRPWFWQTYIARILAALSIFNITQDNTRGLGSIAALVFLAYYLLGEPLLDFGTDAAVGLVTSAFARTQSMALGAAILLGAVHIGAQYAIVALLAENSAGIVLCTATILILATVRFAILRGLLALAVWRAAQG